MRERLNRDGPPAAVPVIPSGAKLLDLALGGGWAEDKIINLVGDSGSGKTLLAIEMSANFIHRYPRGSIAYRETEAAFQPDYAAALGMPLERVSFGQPLRTVEALFCELEQFCQERLVPAKSVEVLKLKPRVEPMLYIVDSLDGLSDRAELDRPIDKGSYGAQKAKSLSELFRRLTVRLNRARITLVIVSQVRDKIGVTFGSTKYRSGGRALEFYATQVVWLAQRDRVMRKVRGLTLVIGLNVLAKVTKNRIGPAFRESEFMILFNYGIDDLLPCCDLLAKTNALATAGIPADYPAFINRLKLDAARREIVGKVHRAVAQQWLATERSLLPALPKYGG